MITDRPTLGIRFDIGKVNAGFYGQACWKIIWAAVDPEMLERSDLFEGDTDATLQGRENVFCIAIQNAEPALLAAAREALAVSKELILVAATPMFVEGNAVVREPLPRAGKIDGNGILTGDALAARSALGAIRKERQPLSPPPPSNDTPRAKPASDRTHNLPALSSFEDLRAFVKVRFTPKEYLYSYWMTPEELCDIVEEYADLVEVQFKEYSCPLSEDLCSVRLFQKNSAEGSPIELVGLFPFATPADAARFPQEYKSNPEYARALPHLAGIQGRFQMNFGRGNENARSLSEDPKNSVSPEVLWTRIRIRRERFEAELERSNGVASSAHTNSQMQDADFATERATQTDLVIEDTEVRQHLRELADNYRRAIAYMDNCREWTLEALLETNRISGGNMSEAQCRQTWQDARFIFPDSEDKHPGGTESLRYTMRSTLMEAISTFEGLIGKPEIKVAEISQEPKAVAPLTKTTRAALPAKKRFWQFWK